MRTNDWFVTELEQILSRDVEEVRVWEKAAFDELAHGRPLLLCGAGGLGRRTLRGLRKRGLHALAFVDNNPANWGQMVEGLPVLSPAEAVSRHADQAAFVVTIWGAHSPNTIADRKQQWIDAGCDCVVSHMALSWKLGDAVLPHYTCDLPHRVFEQAAQIREAAALFIDERSQQEYLAQLRWRTELDFPGLPGPGPGAIYFPPDIVKLKKDEVFVDCGAFDGDSLRDFLRVSARKFAKYWAFEPDPGNFAQLQQQIAGCDETTRSKIQALALAVSDQPGKLRFEACGNASSASSASGEVEVTADRLDTVLAGCTPTYLKMDIEGAELDALRGASGVLARSRPILGISAYHKQEDLWKIPNYLALVLADYCYFLRPHDRECWDLVLYAVPAERLLK